MCKKEVEFGTHLFYAVHIVSKAGVNWVIPQSPRNILFGSIWWWNKQQEFCGFFCISCFLGNLDGEIWKNI